MGITVVGSVALDTVETAAGRVQDALGGAATYFALAAAQYTEVHIVGVVGDDFPSEYLDLMGRRGINLDGLERAPGKTFRWSGKYHQDVNVRDTLDTQLNVFERFRPELPQAARNSEYLFLCNIQPSLQLEVLGQSGAKFVGLDTMNFWIDNALEELKTVLRQVDVVIINDAEAHQLSGEHNLVKAARYVNSMGPKRVVVKKGEHGCFLLEGERMFCAPAFPLEQVRDPTGAGDTFAGGFMGYLAQAESTDFAVLCKAILHGTVLASFTCEDFGPGRLLQVRNKDIAERYRALLDLMTP